MTNIYRIDPENIDKNKMRELANIIQRGGTVVFPTETVYGLGANALSEEAVDKIFKAKGRPSDNPLIVHIYNKEQLNEIAKEIPEKAKILIDKFWPGPLTLLFEKKDIVPDKTTAGLKTVAVRMPDSKIALALIEKSELPIAAPSANISGKPSPTRAEDAINDLYGKVDAIIEGEDCRVGLESTVIDVMNDPPVILRPGGVTIEEISEVIDSVIYDSALDYQKENLTPKSPGQKYAHYAPEGKVFLFKGSIEKIADHISLEAHEQIKQLKKVMVIGTDENISKYKEGIIFSLGTRTNLVEISSKLFSLLIKADKIGADVILIEGFEEKGLGAAIMNRLKKASSGRIVKCGD